MTKKIKDKLCCKKDCKTIDQLIVNHLLTSRGSNQ